MALPQSTAVLNPILDIVEPAPTGSWTALSTWAAAPNWNPTAAAIEWVSEPLALSPGPCAIEIISEAVGDVEYDIWLSSNGAYAGEETSVNVALEVSQVE